MSTVTGNKVTRGEKILSAMAADGLISEQGKCWVECALDPFHDHQLKRLDGYPDVQTGASVVRIVKQSVSISKPAGLPVGVWDCHVVQWPWLTTSQTPPTVSPVPHPGGFQNVGRNGQIFLANKPATLSLDLGGLQAFGVQSGTNLSLNPAQAPQTTFLAGQLNVPQVFTKGVTRLIGAGFEVHNTTSQLNVQGAVLGWRQMANDNENVSWTYCDTSTTPSTLSTFSGPVVRSPPINTQEAMLLAGSRQWEAKDGVYSVSAFHTTENPATNIVTTCPVVMNDAASDLEGSIPTTICLVPCPGAVQVPTAQAPMVAYRIYNIHQSGAIFSGLSDSTTLQLNWNVFLETFPASDDQEILPLATPSAEFDPDVLDLYSRIIVDLPVAVPVSENGLGDWFYDAAATAAKYIGPVLSMIPHPLLKGAGLALEGMSKVMEENKSKPKKKKKNPPSQQAAPPNAWGPPPLPRRTRSNYLQNRAPAVPRRTTSAPPAQGRANARGRSRTRRNPGYERM